MTAEDLILAVRASLRGMPGAAKLRTVQDAQRVAAQAAKRAGTKLTLNLADIPRGDVRQVVFETVREIDRVAAEAARRMQVYRAQQYGEENLGVAETPFNANRARNLATYADGLLEHEATEGGGLMDTLENNARMVVDDAEQELADTRYGMGKRPVIVRTAMGANSCAWCLSAAGEYEYGPDMDKTMAFGRHANCDCLIEYHPGTGRVETVRNYRRKK